MRSDKIVVSHDIEGILEVVRDWWERAFANPEAVTRGFPDILEMPVNAWQDVMYREQYGIKDIQGYLAYLKTILDYTDEHNLTWGLGFHDFTATGYDPQMSIVSGLLEYAQKKNVPVMSCKDYYQECKSQEG